MREVRRCLHDSGTVWLNVGDSYARQAGDDSKKDVDTGFERTGRTGKAAILFKEGNNTPPDGMKPKDLCLVPWRLIIALQEDGWWCRSVICWAKKAPMPESCTDRPTSSWEPIFLLAKSANYFYDHVAVMEPSVDPEGTAARYKHEFWGKTTTESKGRGRPGGEANTPGLKEWGGMKNQRNVWHLSPESLPDYDTGTDHYAAFPSEIPRRAILAGTSAKGVCPKCFAPYEREVERIKSVSKPCPKTTAAHHARGGVGEPVGTVGKSGGGRIDGYTTTTGWRPTCECDAGDVIPATVLDPFGGSGTTGMVATELGRNSILCELNDEYLPLIERRTNVTPGLNLA